MAKVVPGNSMGKPRLEVVVRTAREADLPGILSVYSSAGLEKRGSLELADARRLFSKISSYPFCKLYVAEAEGQLLGSFELLIMDNFANGGLRSGLVEDVAVAREAQGRGVGKAMMLFAMEECRREGCYKMALSSNEIRVEAHAFYESLGFTRHGFSFRVELSR